MVYLFGTEERLVQQQGYPEQRAHKKVHDDLTKKAQELKEAFNAETNA